jgi:beta-N-acetylhexosaminidase
MSLFSAVRPWGFILFARNVESPDQVRALTASLRATVGRADAPILMDQEGGRVRRLRPPHWPDYPPAGSYLVTAGGIEAGRKLVRQNALAMARDLRAVGVNVDCAPVLDVPTPDADEVIGDRAFSDDPLKVAIMARAMAEGLLEGGVLPVLKHIPGHGRAPVDSHMEVPVVEASLEELEARDMLPFRALRDLPVAMTAHVIYASVDPDEPATTSRRVITQLVRGQIGFEGLLLSDDLSMQALRGGLELRASGARASGCDVVLHCNGDLAEMRAVANGAGNLGGQAAKRAAAALDRIAGVGAALAASRLS